jgi:hypothetical protein
MLAATALRSQGVDARFQHENANRIAFGRQDAQVEVPAAQFEEAREILRELRGRDVTSPRADRHARASSFWVAVLITLAVSAALAVLLLIRSK